MLEKRTAIFLFGANGNTINLRRSGKGDFAVNLDVLQTPEDFLGLSSHFRKCIFGKLTNIRPAGKIQCFQDLEILQWLLGGAWRASKRGSVPLWWCCRCQLFITLPFELVPNWYLCFCPDTCGNGDVIKVSACDDEDSLTKWCNCDEYDKIMTLQLNITGVEDLFIYTGVFTGGKVKVNLN